MKKVIACILFMMVLVLTFSCDGFPTNTVHEPTGIKSIHIDQATIMTKEDVETFDISKINLVVNFYDQDELIMPLTKEMLTSESLLSLKTPGLKEITVNYQGFSCRFQINLVKKVNVTFYASDEIIYQTTLLQGDHLSYIPKVPTVLGMIGEWDQTSFADIMDDLDVHAIYSLDENDELNQVVASFDALYDMDVIEHDLTFTHLVGGIIVEYETNSPYLSNTGEIKRSYNEEDVELICHFSDGTRTITRTYHLKVAGYKSLDNGIASGYLYRNYGILTDEFFDTLDIIYCAFIEIDENGDFVGNDAAGKTVANNNRNVKAKIAEYIKPKAEEKGIYIVPSLGGSAASATFKLVSSNATLRKQLAQNIVKLINENGYDGIDIDWETPGTTYSKDFTLMMEEIYNAVKANNPNHLITAAIGGGKWQPPYYDLTNSGKYLDYINVMCYGMTSNTGYYQNALYPHTSYDDTVNKVGRTLTSCSISDSVRIYNNLGITNDKLIFGAAFYGIRQNKNDGSWENGGSIFFDSILNQIATGNYQYHFDEVAKVPYLISNDGLTFISYDDERSIIEKCHFVLENGCAGIMYWENGCDTTNTLMHALNIGLNKDPSYFNTAE